MSTRLVYVLLLLVVGESFNFLFPADPSKLVKCVLKKSLGNKDLYVPENSTPTQCIASGPTEGMQCSIRNYKKHFPDACENIEKDLQSKPPPQHEVCQPLLFSISLFGLSCENVLAPPVISLNFTFQLPQCDAESAATATSVKVNFNTDVPNDYYHTHPICRVFNYTGSTFTSPALYTKKILITYEWMAVGIHNVGPKINYALNLTAYPSSAQLNYTVAYKEVGSTSMRLLAGAWRTRQIAHFVFMPIKGIMRYVINATSDQQQEWKFSQKVSVTSFEILDIPDSLSVITVTVIPSDDATCKRPGYQCSTISVTLPDKNKSNLPVSVFVINQKNVSFLSTQPSGRHQTIEGMDQELLALIVLACVAVLLLLAIIISIVLFLRCQKQPSSTSLSGHDMEMKERLEPILCITCVLTCSTLKQWLKDHKMMMQIPKDAADCINKARNTNNILIIIHNDMQNLHKWNTFCSIIQVIFENQPLWKRIRVISLDEGHEGCLHLPSEVLQNSISGNYSVGLMGEFLSFLDNRTYSQADYDRLFNTLSETHQNRLQHSGHVAGLARSECSGQSCDEHERVSLLPSEGGHRAVVRNRDGEENGLRQENGSCYPNGMIPRDNRQTPDGSTYIGEREHAPRSETFLKVTCANGSDETFPKVPHAGDSGETFPKVPQAADSDETFPKVPCAGNSDETFPKVPGRMKSDETTPKVPHALHSDEWSHEVLHAHKSGVENTDSFPSGSNMGSPDSQHTSGSENVFPMGSSRMSSSLDSRSNAGNISHRSGIENTDSFPSESTRLISDSNLKPVTDDVLDRIDVENTYHFSSGSTTQLPGYSPYRSGVENTDSFPSESTRMIPDSDQKPITDDVLDRIDVENTCHSPSGCTTQLPGDIPHRSEIENTDSFPSESTRLIPEESQPIAVDVFHRLEDENSCSSNSEIPVCGPEEYMSNKNNGQIRGQGRGSVNDENSQYRSTGRELDLGRTEERNRPVFLNNIAPSVLVPSGPEDYVSFPPVSFHPSVPSCPGTQNSMNSSPVQSNGIPSQEKNPDWFSPIFQQNCSDSDTHGRELIARDPNSDREHGRQRYDGEWNGEERIFLPEFYEPDTDDESHKSTSETVTR